MDEDFRRTVLFIVALYIFISFALDDGEGENDSDENVFPFSTSTLQ